MSSPACGLIVLHGNRLEDLRDLTLDWLATHPLAPLATETLLIQSTGIAQWLKIAIASHPAMQVAAGLDTELPSRFLWRMYRTVLGKQAVPRESPFDKDQLQWRLLRLLPALLADPAQQAVYAPLARFLQDDADGRKPFQLAQKLADLFDQYQVYRADWLSHWASGQDVLDDFTDPVPDEQRWQPALWRAIRADLGREAGLSRADIHERYLAALRQDTLPGSILAALPPRVVVFGISALPQQWLDALAALAKHTQVIIAVLNPSQFYWGDVVESKWLLRRTHQRVKGKKAGIGREIKLDAAALHLNSHPLLAQWGRQGRDYIRLLDERDQTGQWLGAQAESGQPASLKVECFTPPPADTLLAHIQRSMLDLEPPPADPAQRYKVVANDRSLAFHRAHSPQREVEILHDQLLAMFEADKTLTPRDIIVMVPDIAEYTPHISAVFGRDSKASTHIPHVITDQGVRRRHPLLVALDTLLALDTERLTASTVFDLLDVPALRQRFELTEDELPQLHDWVRGAQVRWGLSPEHRQAFGVPPVAQNTWVAGLKRMLLGYAVGDAGTWCDIEPYFEVAGMAAASAGKLAMLISTLETSWQALQTPATPAIWQQRLSALLDAFFSASDEDDLALLNDLQRALARWQEACEGAGFNGTLTLAIVRESWLNDVDAHSRSQRYPAASVTFATLMPMRAIPYRVVCLLGLHDGAYPRRQQTTDFDLMASHKRSDGSRITRPGDRARRDDDRYLLLEALLSARDALHISWVGHSARDNSERPASVLIEQLRDYLDRSACPAAAPDHPLAEWLTTSHPLQPFSAAYLAGNPRLYTYAAHWHASTSTAETDRMPILQRDTPLTLTELARFYKDPVGSYYRDRLRVNWQQGEALADDDEPFTVDRLQETLFESELVAAALAVDGSAGNDAIQAKIDALRRAGSLPVAGFADAAMNRLEGYARLAQRNWRIARDTWQIELPAQPFALAAWDGQPAISDLIGELYQDEAGQRARLVLLNGGVQKEKGQIKLHRLADAWIRHLALNTQDEHHTLLIAYDHVLTLAPLDAAEASERLDTLRAAWLAGMNDTLPAHLELASEWYFALGKNKDTAHKAVQEKLEGGHERKGLRDYDLYFGQRFADYAALQATDGNETWREALYAPLASAVYGDNENVDSNE
ncbi:exodeoxyribonuclease V subunit gamma [Chitinilyticum piscinae]|uniref:RecBCD enzyme subunit RecC n=1 Tax=Chitinilyticum piscinae TaxID=2866724 RepID=A0A8J7K7X6_9NEIS|nr:exodeoxyribonuclease V subunit gamma [Chitinilyticum piscinae]MBE9608728.1 exodeoxyribonuclease V subunit gamma [Chitinilyticum piscinae]